MKDFKKCDYKMKKIDLIITKEMIKGKEEYFLTKQYDDGSPDESIPIDFHRKCREKNENSNPWEMFREQQRRAKEDKNEKALEKPVKTVSRYIKIIEKHQKKMNERALERPVKMDKKNETD